MKRGTAAVVVLAALGAAFLAGVSYNQRAGASVSALRARRVLYYVDRMHPGYRSDKPGIAPDCGMPLEPMYEDQGGPAAVRTSPPGPYAIHVSIDQQALSGVQVGTVQRAAGRARVRLYGRVAADETRQYRINVGIDGYIRDVSTATTGSRVVKGDWLATISAPDLRAAAQAYLVTLDIVDRSRKAGDGQAQLDLASAGVQQAMDRLLTMGMSPVQMEEIKRTRLQPPNMRITAPADGFVLARSASIGQRVANGDELYRVADLGHVWVMADAFGSDVVHLAPGLEARVSIPGRAASFAARVSRDVPPQFDADSQSAKVRLEADNPSAILRPGMFVDVDVMPMLVPAVEVPADAIVDSGLAQTVFVEKSAGVFEPREVETGRRSGGRVEIVKGLAAGERVVVAGTFVVDAERRVRGAAGVQALP